MTKIELITAEVCPYAQRTHMTLLEKGLTFERREVDLANKPDWFIEVSPTSKVPVVKIGDSVVYESAVINEFIDEMYPLPALMPSDPFRRAQARIWIDYCNTVWVDDIYDLLYAREPAKQAELRQKVATDLERIETDGMRALSDGPYWLGAEISLVDLTYYPFFERFGAVAKMRGAAIPKGCTRIRAWYDLMTDRASARATAHDDDYYLARYAKWADEAA
jgi:glutathione S-transferase